MGQGCFSSKKSNGNYEYIHTFYNVDTGASYSTADEEDRTSYLNLICSGSDDETIVHYDLYSGYTEYVLMNKKDMSLRKITINRGNGEYLFLGGNIATGVFAVQEGNSNYPNYYFYDVNGNLVLDLSEYKTPHQSPFFANSKCCELDVVNDDTEYTITLDLDGNVLKSVEKTED